MGQGAQFSTSQPVNPANVGALGTWIDANRDTHGTGTATDDTCRLATSYGGGIGDAFFASNPDVATSARAFFGELFFTANNLATNGDEEACRLRQRRRGGPPHRGDPGTRNSSGRSVRAAAGSRTPLTPGRVGHRGGLQDRQRVRARGRQADYDVDSSGSTVVAVGDAGTILNSSDGRHVLPRPGRRCRSHAPAGARRASPRRPRPPSAAAAARSSSARRPTRPRISSHPPAR